MDAASAGIAAGAALAGSALTGFIAVKVSGDQIEAERARLSEQLGDERQAAREERDQDRRLQAYVSLLDHVAWLSFCFDVRRRAVTRLVTALGDIRAQAGFTPRPDSAEEKAAVKETGPTSEERKIIEEGPTNKDGTRLALAAAVSSDGVLGAFEDFQRVQRELFSNLNKAEAAALYPRKGTGGPTASNALDEANELYQAFVRAAKQVRKLVRTELNEPA
jgi:hypothetical protein